MAHDDPTLERTTADACRARGVRDRFEARFGRPPRVYRAPGRVNLIGEHTDYNDGFVLPAALTRSCWVAAAEGPEGRLIAQAEDLGARAEDDLDRLAQPTRSWSDYVFGVAAMLRLHGYDVRGATLSITSDVPMGAGLSSSAALEVAVATALLDLFDLSAPPLDVAVMCQRAENHVVGARCGVMDQFVAAHATAGVALLLDCRSLAHRRLPLPEGVRLVACNTMVRHTVAGGDYNTRVAECAAGISLIASSRPGAWSLRDVDPETLERARPAMPDVIYRRCRHVVSENDRVGRMAAALERGDLDTIGPLMAESHASLRDDYDVSCPELDLMVRVANEVAGVIGARMTGAGFGGCTVNLVRAEAIPEFERHVVRSYEAATGVRPDIYVSEAGAGASRVL